MQGLRGENAPPHARGNGGPIRIHRFFWPLGGGRGQVHVFGQRFSRQTRSPAEKWTSPQPARERLLYCLPKTGPGGSPLSRVIMNM